MATALVAVSGARASLDALAALGLGRGAILAAAGLSEADLSDPDRLLDAPSYYRMWEAAQGLWRRPGLGLQAGARAPLGAYEVLDYLLATGPTLGDGLREFARCFALATRTASYEIDDGDEPVRCAMVWRIPPSGIMFQLRDYSLAAVTRRVLEAGGEGPARVELEGPPLATLDEYRRVFDAPVELRGRHNALYFARSAWRSPLERSDAVLQRTLRRHADLLLERAAAASSESLAQRVRCELLRRIRVGVPALDEISRVLAIGPRTLQRRLREEGTRYEEIADEVRSALAREYLRDRGLTIAEVGYLLGYSEPSAFTRAFRRWTGASPATYRRRGAGAGTA